MPLSIGDPIASFTAATPGLENFRFDTVAGRYVVLAFLPESATAEQTQSVVRAVTQANAMFDDQKFCFFGVLRSSAAIAQAQNFLPGIRWFLDRDQSVFRHFSMFDESGGETARWVLLDPTLRLMHQAPLAEGQDFFQRVSALPEPSLHAGVSVVAPILIVPRVLEPSLCAELVELFNANGGRRSGVMRSVDGDVREVMDDTRKRRSDFWIEDPVLKQGLRQRLMTRLAPEVHKAFQMKIAEVERYLVSQYDSESADFFKPHRDNTTALTQHRKFAATINLNADDYEGGELRFPEFGSRTYRAPTGGAVVFSCSLMHEATPVTAGKRFAFLPFLYDEEGAVAAGLVRG
jgi:predicted 2-oxoglutarate/Fe(II)-dependent dioxygenase YbiX/peroxiredoxin